MQDFKFFVLSNTPENYGNIVLGIYNTQTEAIADFEDNMYIALYRCRWANGKMPNFQDKSMCQRFDGQDLAGNDRWV